MRPEEKGANFMQAQGNEKQCPIAAKIQIGARLARIEFADRDSFCHRKMEVQKYSEGIPQVPVKYILAPELACKVVAHELLKQLGIVTKGKASNESREILDRWKDVATKNADKNIYDFQKRDGVDVLIEVEKFITQFVWEDSLSCPQEPKQANVDIEQLD